MEISVIVTNYNYGRFIGRCLRSLTDQSVSQNRFEIVVVDDASTDDSRAIIGLFADRIKAINLHSNGGLSNASNIAINASTGRYIVRVDSDDFVHRDFLHTLLLGFELLGRECEAISTDYLLVDSSGEYIGYGSQELNPIACGIAFKMDALESLGYYTNNLRFGEDTDLKHRFDDSGYRQVHVNLPLYRYVQHTDSLSRSVLI